MSYEDECNEYYFGIPFKKRVSAAEVGAKFKVGDRVLANGNFSFDPSTGTVVEDGGSYYSVHIDTTQHGYGHDVWNYLHDELTLAPTIAIGDRVKLKRHYGPHAMGDEGKVYGLITKAGFVNAGVEMDPWGVYTVFPVEVLELVADCAVRKEQPAPKFKAGDRVNNGYFEHTIKCVRTHSEECPGGKPYTGPLAYDYTDGDWDRETDITLVTAAPCAQDNRQQPAIVARVLDGQPRPSNIPFVHASSADALTEAERLAKNNPGQEFAVYQRVGARVASVEYKMKEVA